jgi:hypothetical protein
VRHPGLVGGPVNPTNVAVDCGYREAGEVSPVANKSGLGSVLPWLESEDLVMTTDESGSSRDS